MLLSPLIALLALWKKEKLGKTYSIAIRTTAFFLSHWIVIISFNYITSIMEKEKLGNTYAIAIRTTAFFWSPYSTFHFI